MRTIGNLEEQYADCILVGAPESDRELETYVLGLVDGEVRLGQDGGATTRDSGLPEVSGSAKTLAEQIILQAKAETLEKLGEHRAAEALAEKLVREQTG